MPSKTMQRLKKVQTQKTATSPKDWRDLAQKALSAAQTAGDRRAQGIQQAIERGRIQQTLRAMSIICENDILREFPPL